MAQTSAPASTPASDVNAAAAATQPFPTSSLYVGDIHPDVTEALLFEIFNAVGPVASIRVCRDAVTRRSLGYAYVNFHHLADAERALDTMNYTNIKGVPCRIMWSQRDPSLRRSGVGNIFVKNLDTSIDNKALYDTFSLFGNILSCKVVNNPDGSSKGYGYVHYETAEAATEAIEKINGMLIAGQEVFVGHFQRRNERPDEASWTNCFVKNIPKSWSEERLRQAFEPFGTVASCVIMKDNTTTTTKLGGGGGAADAEAEAAAETEATDADATDAVVPNENNGGGETTTTTTTTLTTESRGFGFVDFENPDAAQAAMDALNGTKIKDEQNDDEEVELFVGRAQKKNERERELRLKFEQMKMERINKYQGVNLYVKNLDEQVTDDELREAFAVHGTITSSRVMVDEHGAPRGFGFVCFSNPEEANKAVTEMNGKLLNGKPIYVALAQRKEVRRAQLEAQHAQRVAGLPAGRGMPMGQPPMYGAAPMFYAQPNQMPPQARQGFVYPQQVMPRGVPHNGGPMPYGGRGGAPGYQMPPTYSMPMQPRPGRGGRRQGAMPGGRGGGNSGRGGPGAHNHGGSSSSSSHPPHQNRNFKYTANARNQPPQAMPPQQPMPLGAAPGGGPLPHPPTEPLTSAALANASPEQQKNMIGERLYPLIHNEQPELAGKITGMLLEMDNGELLHLLESPDALTSKIQEAIQVLEAHSTETQD